jgi:NAD(P)-dependent dehydrogenase (short-subunit alcohol dehydrogenase family)
MSIGQEGLRVLVSAAGSGIGRAIAGAFLDRGAVVGICDVDPGALARFCRDYPDGYAGLADVGDPAQVDRWLEEALAALGGCDVLVNNAGIAGPTGPIEDCEPADWRRTLSVNLDGTYHCLRRVVPVMKQARSGSIVNIASSAGILGYPLRTPYAAAKWAVVGLTKSLAMELGPHGIRVNAVCPGAVDGPRMDRVIAAEAAARDIPEERVREGYLRQSSLRSFVAVEDIANTVLFLCSGAGEKISGQALPVDGHTETLSN